MKYESAYVSRVFVFSDTHLKFLTLGKLHDNPVVPFMDQWMDELSNSKYYLDSIVPLSDNKVLVVMRKDK